jgi:di/tricarboxylate transporter
MARGDCLCCQESKTEYFEFTGPRWRRYDLIIPSLVIAHMLLGIHCSDMGTSAEIDPSIKAIHVAALKSFQSWLPNFKPGYKNSRREVSAFARKPVSAWFRGAGVI